MLYLAMSCFQRRPQLMAYEDLIALSPDGVQLTPGNLPSSGFKEQIKVPYRFHHGFAWDKPKRNVYDGDNMPIDIGKDHSIHPPQKGHFATWIEQVGDYILETMYPGYLLGNGEEIEIAMSLGKRLAVDISHVFIMKTQGVISDSTINKLFDYEKIEEIHVSHNEGRFDSHLSIGNNTPYLNWAKSRLNLNVVYEGYMHKLSLDERLKQVDFIRS